MPAPFQPKHLGPEQVEQLWRQALVQAEAAAAGAWLNLLANPGDPVTEAAYAQAVGRVEAIEADLERVCPPSAS